DHVIGSAQGLAAARAMRLPGTRIATRRVPGVRHDLVTLAHSTATLPEPLPEPDDDAECAVVFTSGATGPAKGVVYRHRQVQAQVDLIRRTYALTRADRLVAAFAPFAIYGPALGIASAVPDVDVTRPASLTAGALADAVAAVDATVVFASPAALRNVVATGDAMQPLQRNALSGIRLLMSAGAPVGLPLLRSVQRLLPRAALHTPYGMTEALPVADVSLPQLAAAGEGDGVCVGVPLPGVDVRVSPLSSSGAADGEPTDRPGVTGEVCVRAPHVKDRYDALWATERRSSRDPGWHRTGDVGHLDAEGRLWVEGRLQHVVTTPRGPLTPVGVEQRVEALDEVRAAAVVGVGPVGTQAVAVVVVPEAGSARSPVAGLALTDRVRAAAGTTVAAVLVRDALPVDVRHASKVDRAAVARWAADVLAGS
ncbi:MAG: AMP-binding protein, partial [Actinomycetota bacterium]